MKQSSPKKRWKRSSKQSPPLCQQLNTRLFALWCANTANWVGRRNVSFIPTSGTTELPSYSITLVQPQLLMGRHIWTSLPQSDDHLIPKWPYLQGFREQNQSSNEKQKRDFDRRHQVQELPAIPDETEMWMKSDRDPVQGRVVSSSDCPSSYVIDTESPTGQVHRNRCQLTVVPDRSPDDSQQAIEPEPARRIVTRSQTGTPIHPPERLS